MMTDYVSKLRRLIAQSTPLLLALPEAATMQRPAPGKWAPREILGHLVDSASVNHERFIRAQFQESMHFSGYDQDAWVSSQQYRKAPWDELVALWGGFNSHLARVMEAIPASTRERERDEHNLNEIAWEKVPAHQPVTLDYSMGDYVGHLEHHLRQILGSELDL